MRATLLRLSSATSHASKLSPELWSSESFAKRVQTLRENALEKRDFPRSLYPLVPRGVKVTPIREFVGNHWRLHSGTVKDRWRKEGIHVERYGSDVGCVAV